MLIQAIRQFAGLPLAVMLLTGIWLHTEAALAFSVRRIIPAGRVEAHDGDQVVQVYTREAPFPEGRMLKTQGRCGVRLDDFYLVADDGSVFGIENRGDERVLTVEQGMVYLALARLPSPLVFQTPAGVFPARQIRVHAAAGQGVIKSYLSVRPDRTEIGVLEGGAMVVSTPEGDRQIEPGRQITIAQALLFEEEEEGQTEDTAEPTADEDAAPAKQTETVAEGAEKPNEGARIGYYVAGGLAAVAVIGGAFALGGGGGGSGSGSGGGGGGNGSVSPSAP